MRVVPMTVIVSAPYYYIVLCLDKWLLVSVDDGCEVNFAGINMLLENGSDSRSLLLVLSS